MKKKIISILIILIVIGAFIANHLITFARETNETLYVNLSATDPENKVGYGIGDADDSGQHIWNIITNDLTSEPNANPLTGRPSDEQRNLYCVNAEYGISWFGDKSQGIYGDVNKIVSYELAYDIQDAEDRAELSKFNNTMINNLILQFAFSILRSAPLNPTAWTAWE